MSNLRSAVQQLQQEHKHALQQVEKLQSAISLLEDLVARSGSGASRDGARPGRILSATARRRVNTRLLRAAPEIQTDGRLWNHG